MQYIPNPLLTFLLRRAAHTPLTWRFVVALTVLLTIGGAILILIIMLNTDDYFVREDYETAFGWGYLLYIGGSLLLPVIMAVFGTIMTSTWTSRDEKFDLLRLTHLHERAFAESYFVVVLHRLRLLLGMQAIFGFLTPIAVLVTMYWSDHPSSSYYYGYSSDYREYIPLSTYLGVYILLLLLNVALAGLSIIGGIVGVRFGIAARTMTNAIILSVGWTLGSYLGIAVVVGGGLALTMTFIVPDAFFLESPFLGFISSYCCIGTLCFLPIGAMWVNYMKLTQRAVHRRN
ncbi:MAG: hypothetical protein BroJett018_24660 [Chloroflexota bacterium]|nr:MAG: hypothetical protein BroJett018_24660 [Chloroflexota bacterium]